MRVTDRAIERLVTQTPKCPNCKKNMFALSYRTVHAVDIYCSCAYCVDSKVTLVYKTHEQQPLDKAVYLNGSYPCGLAELNKRFDFEPVLSLIMEET